MTTTPPEAPPAAPPAPAGDPAPQPTPPPAPAPNGDQPTGDDLANLPADKLAEMVKQLRQENARDRTGAKQTAAEEARTKLIDSLKPGLVELGLLKADDQPDADQLTAALTGAQETARVQRVELEVYKTADEHGGKAAALLDSRTFLDTVKGLDPAAADFRDKVIAASKKAVHDNPTLRLAPVAGRGGAEFAGGSGDTRRSDVKPGIDRLRNAYR